MTMHDPGTHWRARLGAMCGQRWPIRCGHVFTADEITRLRNGAWPRDMDDRWAVWLDGNTLRCWRSWSGICVYEADVLIDGHGSGVAQVLDVLDEASDYQRATTESSELQRFEGVLQRALQS